MLVSPTQDCLCLLLVVLSSPEWDVHHCMHHRIGLQGREETAIGSHAQAIQCVEFIKERGGSGSCERECMMQLQTWLYAAQALTQVAWSRFRTIHLLHRCLNPLEHLDCLCMDDAYRHSELGQEVCIAALINLALYVELDSRKRGKCSIPKIKSKIDVPNHGITKVHVHHQLSVTLPQNVPKLWGG